MQTELHTKKWQRITIWIITIALVGGTLGFYILLIMQTNSANQQQAASDMPAQQEELKVDTSAYKVEGDVTQLQTIDLKEGSGAVVQAGDTIRVHYKGTIAQTGEKFDSSYDRGMPITFSLEGVIQGWQQGIPGMKEGGKRRLIVPSELAYGATGSSDGSIAPNSDLVFEVEVISIQPAEAPVE